jgi:hypothetical protein
MLMEGSGSVQVITEPAPGDPKPSGSGNFLARMQKCSPLSADQNLKSLTLDSRLEPHYSQPGYSTTCKDTSSSERYGTVLVRYLGNSPPSSTEGAHTVPYSQCCGSGSGIRCLFDPWIRDSGWVNNQVPDPG